MNEWQILMVFACGIAFDRLMRWLETSEQDQPTEEHSNDR